MTERVVIAHVGRRGDGVAETATGPIYVAYALPGESVDVDAWPGHSDRRHLIRVETESPERIAPFCPHFGTCGGCAIQHWRPDRYRAWKRDLVVTALAQAGLEAPVADIIDAHGEGRRRAVLHARRGNHDVLQVGFAAPRAHHIIAIDRCPILAPGLDGAIEAAWAIAEATAFLGKPLDIQTTATECGLDVDIRGSGALGPQRMAALARVAESHRLARLTQHGELVAQRVAPTLAIGRTKLRLPPGAFLQATAEGEATLARLVIDAIGAAKTVLDLFTGVGPFALRLAERSRVMAADNDEAAIAALKAASSATSGLKPIEVERRDLYRRPFLAGEFKRFDAVMFDPPRQGAEAQVRELAASSVPVVVAVSCNATTFARDARILVNAGYRLGTVIPVDQFRHSAHVEIVASFMR
jgi:23S rRNA (uracil1939-C5)-methyltransferase